MTEKEYKLLLTEEEYRAVLARYQWDEVLLQRNHYYDTAQGALHKKGYSLRVREIAGRFMQQLKSPDTGENAAYTSRTETEQAVEGAPPSLTLPALAAVTEGRPLLLLGVLQTVRRVKRLPGMLLCLDENRYLGALDYELELEFTASPEEAEALLLSLGLPPRRRAPGKYSRFMERRGQTCV